MTQQGSDRKSGNILEDILFNGQLAWKLMTDPRVALLSKVLIPLAGVLYFILPIDLLPDFIPVLGQLDEVAIILLLVRLFIALAPQEIVAEYKAAMGHGTGQPKNKRSTSSGAGAGAKNGSQAGSGQAKAAEDVIDADFRVQE
jgi:uncharacterized membrane protein YkvA (DUF1232 family)